jgi:hypothetical protein
MYKLWIKFLNLFRKNKYYPGRYNITLNGKDLGSTTGGVWIGPVNTHKEVMTCERD